MNSKIIGLLSHFKNFFFVFFVVFCISSGADNPTYLKENGDKLQVTVGMIGVVIGVSTILTGLWNMSWGVGKVAKA